MERFLNGNTLEELGASRRAQPVPTTMVQPPLTDTSMQPPDFRSFFNATNAGLSTDAFSQAPNFPVPAPSFAPLPHSIKHNAFNFTNPYDSIDPDLAAPALAESQASVDPSMRSFQSSEQGSYTTLATSVSSRAPTPSLKISANDVAEKPKKKKAPAKKADGEKPAKKDRSGKPPYSYAALIGQAIFAAPDNRISLNDIYTFIIGNYAYYKKEDAGWQNSIRHNLSLNECFAKTPRDVNQPGKGALWTVVAGCEEQFANGGFVKKGGARKPKEVAPPKAKAKAKAPITSASGSGLLPPASDAGSAAASPAPSENDGMSDTSYMSTNGQPPKKRARREASLFSQPPSASSSTTTFPDFDKVTESNNAAEEEDIDIPLPPPPPRRSHRRRQSTMRDTQMEMEMFQLPNRNEALEPIKPYVLGSPKLSSASAVFGTAIAGEGLPTHQELAAALLASPVAGVAAGLPLVGSRNSRDCTPPSNSFSFLPAVQIRQNALRSPDLAQSAEFGGPMYNMFSANIQSPVSSLRGPAGSPRQTSNIRGDDEDEDAAVEDDEMPAPTDKGKGREVEASGEDQVMSTPVAPAPIREDDEPTLHARQASRALQFMQERTPGVGTRPYMTSPGKHGSPMGHYGWVNSYSDPYDHLGNELERLSDKKTNPFSTSFPQTPKGFGTPFLGSGTSMYSPAW